MSTPSHAVSRDSNLRAGEFYGNVTNRYTTNGLILSEIKHAGPRTLPTHTHEHAFFCLLLGGGYSERFGRREVAYDPFTVAYHPSATSHADEIGRSGGHLFSVEVDDRWIERLSECGIKPANFASVRGGDVLWLAARLHHEFRRQDACSPLAIEGLVLELLAAVGRSGNESERPAPRWMDRVVEVLREEFRENLSLDRLATEVGVDPIRLSKAFRRAHGRTIGEFVQELRVRAACTQLVDPEVPLADVALACGFSDQSHLTRIFKRVTGTTPGAYRRTVPGAVATG
jgi:AraC family transcriptional regulator